MRSPPRPRPGRSATARSSCSASTRRCASAPAKPMPRRCERAHLILRTGVNIRKFKKSSRAGLLALACGLGLAAFVSLFFIDVSFAQAPAPPPAAAEPAAAAPAADAAPPACDAKVQTNCTPNSGDTAWMLTSVALVLMMTIPGLGLFYGGMVRKKNVGDTIMTSFAITCLITILWVICTYSMAFTGGSPYLGGVNRAFLQRNLSDISKGIGQSQSPSGENPET